MRRQRDISAGSYPTPAVVQRLKSTLTLNAAGHIDETVASNWETHLKRWIRVEYGTSAEASVADSQQAQRTVTVAIKYDKTAELITPGMRWLVGSAVLSIVGRPANFDGQNRELVMTCREVT